MPIGGKALFEEETVQFGAINKAIFLNISWRFKDDEAFGEVMRRFRNGTITKDDIALINSRYIDNPDVKLPPQDEMQYACAKNSKSNAISSNIFLDHLKRTHPKLDDNTSLCPAHTVIIKAAMTYGSKKGNKVCMSTQNKIYDQCGDSDVINENDGSKVDPALKFYHGVPLMVVSNKRIKEKLANGTRCFGMYVVLKKHCSFKTECWEGYRVNTVMANEVAYIICKREKKNESDKDSYFKMKPCSMKTTVSFRDLQKIDLCGITMQQFPFNSNIATTCHKLQGKTLKRLIINSFDYSKKNWVYVVLSRITSLQGLVLLEKLDDTRDFSCNNQLLRWEKRIKHSIERKTFEQRGLLQEYLEEEKLYDPNNNEDSILFSFYLQRVAKYFDGEIYYGTITTSKPFKSDKGILLWHVQYDDEDSEDFNKEEVIEAMDLYKSKLIP